MSERVKMQTRHSEGVQDVVINGKKQSVTEPYAFYIFDAGPSLVAVDVPKGDLEVFFSGPVAFEKNQFFQPDPLMIQATTKIEESGIHYILSTYVSPRQVGPWLVQTVEVETPELFFDKKAWKFTFSTPEIESLKGNLKIKEINVKWFRSPFAYKDLLSLFRL